MTLLERRRKLLTEHIDILRAVFKAARQRRPFTVEAIVILPDHLHCIWTLPEGDADFSGQWQDIKARFAAHISVRRLKKGERGIWQRRLWEHAIRDERDFERHVNYIHYNPVKHGHMTMVADWPYLSFHRYVRSGIYNPDWAADDDVRRLEME